MLPKTGFQKPTETSQDRAGDSRSTKTDSRSTVVSKGRELPQPECVSTQPRSKPPVQVIQLRSVQQPKPCRGGPMTAVPRTAATWPTELRLAERRLRDNQREPPWPCPLRATAAFRPSMLPMPSAALSRPPLPRSHPQALSQPRRPQQNHPRCPLSDKRQNHQAVDLKRFFRWHEIR